MKILHPICIWFWVTLLSLGSPLTALPLRAAQFVHVAAEIESTQWGAKSGEPYRWTVNCLVGTNGWQMDGEFLRDAKSRCWFTGTNIILTHEIPRAPTQDQRLANSKDVAPGDTDAFVQVATPDGQRWTETFESADGNPGRGAGHRDCLFASSRIAWLAFCSGPGLKRVGRRIYPPNDFWKEYSEAYGWLEETEIFKDDLALPRAVTLSATNGQPILNYRVTASTNVLGWEFPLAFNLSQYLSDIDHGSEQPAWRLHYTAKGKVTAIGVVTKLGIPTETQPAVRK